ncbi:MAG TPA: peptide deformylase, partial [Candidatus Saccharimonadales bacterium]|nr:peptide deformylase [Candidatus Saccharimonadales bacterium]
ASDQKTADDDYVLTDADHARFAGERERGLVSPGSQVLARKAASVPILEITSPKFTGTVARLVTVANGQRRKTRQAKRRRTLVGLAAPQIGESWRIILIDTKIDESRRHFGKLECIINPQVVWRSRETAEGREGCFSAGPVWGLVRRPVAVKISGYDTSGKEITRILEGFSARIACHEIDHLDGIRFPERITSDRKRHWVHTEELLDYPDQAKRWPRWCTLERWEEFKRTAR